MTAFITSILLLQFSIFLKSEKNMVKNMLSWGYAVFLSLFTSVTSLVLYQDSRLFLHTLSSVSDHSSVWSRWLCKSRTTRSHTHTHDLVWHDEFFKTKTTDSAKSKPLLLNESLNTSKPICLKPPTSWYPTVQLTSSANTYTCPIHNTQSPTEASLRYKE